MFIKNKKFIIISIFLIVALGFIVYANSLRGAFVWDDAVLVKGNIYISDFSKIKNIFTEDIGRGGNARFNFYRPLQMLSYMMDFSFWKLNPLGYHLTNIFIHIFSALAVFWLLLIILNNEKVALASSLLFVVFPGYTEAVTYISGRAEAMSGLFLLLALIFYIKYSNLCNFKFYFLTVLFFIMAVLSKESALIFPLLAVLYNYVFKIKVKKNLYIFILSAAILLSLPRFLFLNHLLLPGPGLLERIPGFFAALAAYLKILILPVNLHMEYGSRLFNFGQIRVIIGIALAVLLIFYALKQRKKNEQIFFSICWFFACLLPYSGIFRINAFMAEHWLYLPSIGFFIYISSILVNPGQKGKKPFVLLLVALLLFYSYLTIRQNYRWKDNLTLYRYTIKFAPDSLRINNNLCSALVSEGLNQEAIVYCKRAVRIDPYFAAAFCNLGNAYRNMRNYILAQEAYKKAIKISPRYEYAYNMLGNLYSLVNRKDQALLSYKKALSINPYYSEAQDNLSKILQK